MVVGLDLSNNLISSAKFNQADVNEINLSINNLVQEKINFVITLSTLEILNLNSNRISNLTGLRLTNMNKLHRLSLSNNIILDFYLFDKLPSLDYLDLSFNNLTSF